MGSWNKNQLQLLEQIKKFDLLDNERRRDTTISYYTNLRSFNKRNANESDDDIDDEKLPCCNTCCGYNCWWEPPSDCYSLEFCRSSSFHGLKFVGEATAHFGQRVLFTIFFILGILASVYLIDQVWASFIESPTIVTFTEQNIDLDNIPFPAITICNVNNVRRSSVNKYKAILENGTRDGYSDEEVDHAFTELQFLQNVCQETSKDFTSEFSFTKSGQSTSARLADFISRNAHKAGVQIHKKLNVQDLLDAADADQPCDQMIPFCLWQNAVINCSLVFHTVITDFGKCCTFNMAPLSLLYQLSLLSSPVFIIITKDFTGNNLEEDQWGNGLNMDSLISKGVKDSIGIPRFDELPRRSRQSGISSGLSVLLFPDIEEYFCTASDSVGIQTAVHLPIDFPHLAEYGEVIGPNTETFIKIKPEVTRAEESVRPILPDSRKCYFNGEAYLKHFKQYSLSNCHDECMALVNIAVCDCVNFYMPSDANWTLCSEQGIRCTGRVQDLMNERGLDVDDICRGCLPTCTSINYKSDVTSRPLNYEVNQWVSTLLNLTELHKEKVSILHFFYGEDVTFPRVRKRLYMVTDLIANIGGLLGLCLGFSILSVVELLYFLIFKMCGKNLHHIKFKRLVRKVIKMIRAKKQISPKNIKHIKPYGGNGNHDYHGHVVRHSNVVPTNHYYVQEQARLNVWGKKYDR